MHHMAMAVGVSRHDLRQPLIRLRTREGVNLKCVARLAASPNVVSKRSSI